jgi:hypothetical protein
MIRSRTMDYVFDKNDKNWPTTDKPRFQNDKIVVSMGENGFKAVTNGAPGVGRAVLSGNNYVIHLPGTVSNASRLEVSFVVAPDRKPIE